MIIPPVALFIIFVCFSLNIRSLHNLKISHIHYIIKKNNKKRSNCFFIHFYLNASQNGFASEIPGVMVLMINSTMSGARNKRAAAINR